MRQHLKILTMLLALGATACTKNLDPDRYDSHAAGHAEETYRGTIVSVRSVTVSSDKRTGRNVGIGAGAVLGSAAGGDGVGGVAGALFGALLGGSIGDDIGKGASKQDALEYIIETVDGRMITIIQTGVPLEEGEPVLLILGHRSRVISDPSAGRPYEPTDPTGEERPYYEDYSYEDEGYDEDETEDGDEAEDGDPPH